MYYSSQQQSEHRSWRSSLQQTNSPYTWSCKSSRHASMPSQLWSVSTQAAQSLAAVQPAHAAAAAAAAAIDSCRLSNNASDDKQPLLQLP